jgi:hypothetical protein
MADPVIVPCQADVWTKAATNVTAGQVHILAAAVPGITESSRKAPGFIHGDISELSVITDTAGGHFPIDSDGSIGIFEKYGAPL